MDTQLSYLKNRISHTVVLRRGVGNLIHARTNQKKADKQSYKDNSRERPTTTTCPKQKRRS